jgi:hypothetical protein
MGLVWLTSFGNVHADIAIIAPNYDSTCDTYFDHQAQIFDHQRDGNNSPDVLAMLAGYIKSYMSALFRPTNEQILEFDSSNENNLHCYAVPKVIEANSKTYLHPIVLINKGLISHNQGRPFFMKDNSSMCCFVSLQAQNQALTV